MPIFSIRLFYKFLNRKIHINSIGFTLIELLVGMGIIAFLGTATVAVSGNFNRNQNIKIAHDDVKNTLAQAKSYALSQVVSDNCDVSNPDSNLREELLGYEVRFDTTTDPARHSYAVFEICEEPTTGTVKDIPPISTYYLPRNIFFSDTPDPITFYVLTGGANIDQLITIESLDQTQTRTINVNTNGVIQ